jgi:hypothetical protein
MKQVFSFLLVLFSLNAYAVNYNAVLTNMVAINATTLEFKLKIGIADATVIQMGSSNFRITYVTGVTNNPGLSNAVLVSDIFTGQPGYSPSSVTNSSGSFAFNTIYSTPINGGVVIPPSGTVSTQTITLPDGVTTYTMGTMTGGIVVATIRMTIVDPNVNITLAYKLSGVGRTIFYDDDNSATLTATTTIGIGAYPLPIEFGGIEAAEKGAANVVSWKTLSEKNVNKFVVERSENGLTDWADLGSVKATGTSNTVNEYTFSDNTPAQVSYYRLRAVDFDGKESRSTIVSVTRKRGRLSFVGIYPNPAVATANVKFEANAEGDLTVMLTDVLGRVVTTQQVSALEGMNNISINLENVAQGTYFVTLKDGNAKISQRLVKL